MAGGQLGRGRQAVRRRLKPGQRASCTIRLTSTTPSSRAIQTRERSVGRLPAGLGIDSVLRTHDEPPFHFVHEPGTPLPEPDRDEPFTIAGHLHPVVALASPSGDRFTDRCFVAEPGLLVMPAFGSFTGGHRVSPTDRARVWIARDDGVVDVSRLVHLAR